MAPRALLCYGVLSDALVPSIQDWTGPPKGPVKDPNSKSQLKKMKKLLKYVNTTISIELKPSGSVAISDKQWQKGAEG